MLQTKDRSELWRERRRKGQILVSVAVAPAHRHALEAIGLLETGLDKDKKAIAAAVEQFLATAPAIRALGDALFPDAANGHRTAGDDGQEINCGDNVPSLIR